MTQLEKYKINQLQEVLSSLGLAKSGNKDTLIQRLRGQIGKLDEFTLSQIKGALSNLELSQKGSKSQLIDRLHQAIDDPYFIDSRELKSPKHSKYCRCLLHVAKEQPRDSLREKKWGRGQPAYNPYAVCTKSVGRQGFKYCLRYYDLPSIQKNFPEEFEALLALKNKKESQLREEWQEEREKVRL